MKNFTTALALAIALCATSAHSQTFKTLVQFSGTSGATIGREPFGSLTLSGTRLYGMTSGGGGNVYGNLFSVGMDGTNYQNLVSFTGGSGSAIGADPSGSLTLSGTTLFGMAGNIFSVGTDGTSYRSLILFTGSSGSASGFAPDGSLILSGATLYGMTSGEGISGYYGNAFSVATDGTNYRNLVSFSGSSGPAIGSYPQGNLTLSGTTLYGMTGELPPQTGNLFSIAADGTGYQDLISFTGTGGAAVGANPLGSLTLGGTTLYGMTAGGGANKRGTVFSVGLGGSNFQSILSFTGTSGATVGAIPFGSLTLSGTTLYGTTSAGGVHNVGAIFSVGIDGSGYQDLYDFTGGANGGDPQGDLTLSGGTLFGMTPVGGTNLSDHGGYGTIFALTLPTPEPGTLALLGGSAAALAAYGWRRMRLRLRRLR